MTNPAEPHPQLKQGSLPARKSRLFWTATAMAILAILLFCAGLVLLAAMRS
jgi:hypothetical protein